MKRLAPLFLLAACGTDYPLRTLVGPGVAVDAGRITPPMPPSQCTVPFSGPSCCGSDGRRLTSATCEDNAYVCSAGAVCQCQGQPQTFWCSDFCGSDAYVEPTCAAGGWTCPGGLVQTDHCPSGTCWGEPGELCAAPQCVNGEWTCGDGGTNDPV